MDFSVITFDTILHFHKLYFESIIIVRVFVKYMIVAVPFRLISFKSSSKTTKSNIHVLGMLKIVLICITVERCSCCYYCYYYQFHLSKEDSYPEIKFQSHWVRTYNKIRIVFGHLFVCMIQIKITVINGLMVISLIIQIGQQMIQVVQIQIVV